ncbi:MAG: hypothetical protein ABH810_03630 [bacterium]
MLIFCPSVPLEVVVCLVHDCSSDICGPISEEVRDIARQIAKKFEQL